LPGIPAGTLLVWTVGMVNTTGIKTFVSATVLALAVFSTPGLAQDPAPQAPGYSWADSCRECHQEIYDAWAKTKHATTLDRLAGGDQDKECVGCHVTGAKARITDGKKVLNRGVQCEACHGAGAAHVADPKAKTALVKTPRAASCEQCHNDKSPKFRGFWFDAMKTLVHKTK
jgi:hypothetical protein